MERCKSLPWKGKFLPLESFNTETVIQLISFHPTALLGGEIRSYQKDVPPLFLKHLSECMPDLLEQVFSKSSYAFDRLNEFSNIGREAILETLTPNVGLLKDIHGGLWTWDGNELHSNNSHMSFGLCKFSKISITPINNQKVKITDEGQVNEHTIFVG